METHVRVAGWLRIVWGALELIGAVIVLLVFGGISAIMGASGDPDAAQVAPWLTGFGAILAAIIGVLALPGIVTGWGLLTYRPWARVLNIVLSVLDLLAAPVGTALGIYSLWVMFHPETATLFDRWERPTGYPARY
jgi:hypothetical protein